MLVHACDKCKKVLKDEKYHSANVVVKFGGKHLSDKRVDFCEDCWNEVNKFYFGNFDKPKEEKPEWLQSAEVVEDVKEPEEEEQVEADREEKTEKTEKKPRKTNTKIDIGKIKSLKNAGWMIKDIAEEMKLEPQQISQAIYQAKKRGAWD